MKKFLKSMFLILFISSSFLVGCSNREIKNKTESDIESNVEKSSDSINKEEAISSEDKKESETNQLNDNSKIDSNIKSSLNESNSDSKKNMYLQKLNELETKLDLELKDKYASPKTKDMTEAASEEFVQWDNMLNEIYSKLEEELSKEDMNKLRDGELDWINNKDLKSKEARDKYKGGSIAPYMELSSLIDSTKKRCYELVNEYIK